MRAAAYCIARPHVGEHKQLAMMTTPPLSGTCRRTVAGNARAPRRRWTWAYAGSIVARSWKGALRRARRAGLGPRVSGATRRAQRLAQLIVGGSLPRTCSSRSRRVHGNRAARRKWPPRAAQSRATEMVIAWRALVTIRKLSFPRADPNSGWRDIVWSEPGGNAGSFCATGGWVRYRTPITGCTLRAATSSSAIPSGISAGGSTNQSRFERTAYSLACVNFNPSRSSPSLRSGALQSGELMRPRPEVFTSPPRLSGWPIGSYTLPRRAGNAGVETESSENRILRQRCPPEDLLTPPYITRSPHGVGNLTAEDIEKRADEYPRTLAAELLVDWAQGQRLP